MATKAEQFKANEQRSHQKPKKTGRTRKLDGAHDDLASGDTARRNLKTSPSNLKGGPALESSLSGKPSRKSTRSSAGRVKLASNLQRREVRRTHSSKARATRAAAKGAG